MFTSANPRMAINTAFPAMASTFSTFWRSSSPRDTILAWNGANPQNLSADSCNPLPPTCSIGMLPKVLIIVAKTVKIFFLQPLLSSHEITRQLLPTASGTNPGYYGSYGNVMDFPYPPGLLVILVLPRITNASELGNSRNSELFRDCWKIGFSNLFQPAHLHSMQHSPR